jgi:glycosyltransferase involved in cell wall biosynthesis
MARLLIVSDAWEPQVNGVVRTIQATRQRLESMGHQVGVIGPQHFRTVPLPTYGQEIRLAVNPSPRLDRMIADFAPDALHLATEGPLGWAGRRYCLKRGMRFTTAVHTRFAEYLARRAPVPLGLGYAFMRRFHDRSAAVMVATPSLARDLAQRGFRNLEPWTRGVDTDLFRPLPGGFPNLAGPVMLYAGRVAVEKNLPAFLDLDLPGSKVVVGDGPQRDALQRRYRDVVFTGALQGDDLVRAYGGADVFVFPSRTDTFGLVMVEALACGTPVAAFPVAGPQDVLGPQSPDAPVGIVDSDLGRAICQTLALKIPAQRCRDFVLDRYTWDIATAQFADHSLGLGAAGGTGSTIR